jgi:hypothetical protein
MKKQFVCGAALVVLILFGSRAVAQATEGEVAQLKKEIALLRAEMEVLKKEMALLKSGATTPGKGLAARLEAVELIGTPSEQQKAYAVLSVDAAKAGDATVAKKSLDRIGTPSIREECMYKAAILLAKSGQSETAVAIAKNLSTPSLREKALTKIAKGEVDD